jgi:imidazolonepropionase-like amidohydrolase
MDMNACLARRRAAMIVLAAAAAIAVHAQRPAGAPEPLLLSNARILDVRAGRYVPAAAVLVSGDRIDAILASPPEGLPPNTRRVDLAGATLVPGFGDMFAAASPDGSADADFYYAMALAHGVTRFRVVGARLPWAASQRDRARSGEILAPRLFIGGPRLEQQAAPSFATRTVGDLQAVRREVTEQASLGAEWVSVGPSASPETYRAIVRAARAARLRVSGQTGASAMAELIRTGVDAVDRVGFFGRSADDAATALKGRPDFPTQDREAAADYLWSHAAPADLRPVVPKTARGQVTVVPLLTSFGGVLDAEELRNDGALAALPASWRDGLTSRAHAAGWSGAAAAARAADARSRLVKALAAAGVRLVTGVDIESSGYNVPGAGVHRELALLVMAGLSPADAIRAATINCADMLGAGAARGEIKVGEKADLVAVEGDPLSNVGDLRRIRLVVRGGEALNPAELLAQARRAARH